MQTITLYKCTVMYNDLAFSPLTAGTVVWGRAPLFQCVGAPEHIIGTNEEITYTCYNTAWDGQTIRVVNGQPKAVVDGNIVDMHLV